MISNTMWIIGSITLKDLNPTLAMPYLAQFVAFGFIGQWALTAVIIYKKGFKLTRDVFSFSIPPEVKKLLKAFSLCALGIGAIGINSFIDKCKQVCV